MARGGPISETHWRSTGHGEGRGAAYQPWLNVRSFGSRGMAHRVRGALTGGRVHHFQSTLELDCFLLLEWNESTRDIREQYPLHELSETQEIAASLGYRHPTRRVKRAGQRATREECTMTTDFFIDFARSAPTAQVAISVEPSSALAKARVLGKLEIERQYWAGRGVPWRLVTEKDLPAAAVRNLKLLRHYRSLEGHGVPEDADVPALLAALHARLSAARTVRLGRACKAFDAEEDLPPGTAAALLWHALATKVWRTDLRELLSFSRPLPGLWLPPGRARLVAA